MVSCTTPAGCPILFQVARPVAAPGGCETDSFFFAGVPRLPDLKDFVFEAGSIVLSLVSVASSAFASLLRGFFLLVRVAPRVAGCVPRECGLQSSHLDQFYARGPRRFYLDPEPASACAVYGRLVRLTGLPLVAPAGASRLPSPVLSTWPDPLRIPCQLGSDELSVGISCI